MDTKSLDDEIKSYDLNKFETYELLRSIPKDYRIPLYLFYYEGYSIKEIANQLKKSESAIKMRLLRGKEALRKEMGGSINE